MITTPSGLQYEDTTVGDGAQAQARALAALAAVAQAPEPAASPPG